MSRPVSAAKEYAKDPYLIELAAKAGLARPMLARIADLTGLSTGQISNIFVSRGYGVSLEARERVISALKAAAAVKA